MSEFVNTIDLLGDDVVLVSLFNKSIIEFKDSVLTSVGAYSFAKCVNLTTVDLPNVTSIDINAFRECTNLAMLILRSNVLCTLLSTYAFYKSSIANGTGYIYVPKALLSDTDSTKDYRRATNWATYANQFRALEDFTIDGTTTGELDMTKI